MKDRINIKIICAMIITILISGLISVSANSNLFSSNEVIYENNKSGLSSTNVHGAVDELYAAATDYSDIKSRVSNLEGYFVTSTSSSGITYTKPTSQFNNAGLELNRNYDEYFGWIDFYTDGERIGGLTSSDKRLNIATKDRTYPIYMSGKDIYMNGTNIKEYVKIKNFTVSNIVVPANGYKEIDVDASLDGYTPVGIIQFHGNGTAKSALLEYFFSGNTAKIYYTDVRGSGSTISSLTITVLYFKN